jgi:hypothetical protein
MFELDTERPRPRAIQNNVHPNGTKLLLLAENDS